MITLITILLILSLLLFTTAFILYLRIGAASRDIQRMGPTGSNPRLRGFASSLLEHIDLSFLPHADERGPMELEVRSREEHDNYRRVDELLRRIVGLAGQSDLSHREELVKTIYQLQDSLALEDDVTDRILTPIIRELMESSFLNSPIGAIETVRAGDYVDRATMWPLSSGTRVRQPLGVVIRDRQGKVLSRAKVFCK